MRLCFYNPHATTNATGDTVVARCAQLLGKNKSNLRTHNLKYGFFLTLLRDPQYNTAIVVDGTDTSWSAVLDRFAWLRNNYFIHRCISKVEIYLWCFLNGIHPWRQTIIFHPAQLDEKSDVLFTFAYCSQLFFNESLLEKSIMKSFQGIKVLHASHFYKQTRRVADNIKKIGARFMVAESNLKQSAYYNRFFEYIDRVCIVPPALRERYKKTTPFQERKNKCLALGTLVIENESDDSNRDFFDFFKINTLHPMRKLIFENKEKLSNEIECCIYFHNEKRLTITDTSPLYRKNKVFKMVYDLFFLSEGETYHKMDIVEKYNAYTMFLAPEEIIGLPSVNVIEGMACGCAYIGLRHSMYADVGMIEGQHFIAYDGTLEDLQSKIRYYQSHAKELAQIAEQGYVFARERFSQERVLKDFWRDLTQLTRR